MCLFDKESWKLQRRNLQRRRFFGDIFIALQLSKKFLIISLGARILSDFYRTAALCRVYNCLIWFLSLDPNFSDLADRSSIVLDLKAILLFCKNFTMENDFEI